MTAKDNDSLIKKATKAVKEGMSKKPYTHSYTKQPVTDAEEAARDLFTKIGGEYFIANGHAPDDVFADYWMNLVEFAFPHGEWDSGIDIEEPE